MKNPLPCRAASRGPELAWIAPCVKLRTVIGGATPIPIADRPPIDSATRSLNAMSTDLKPVVFTLARLWPTVSTAAACAFSAASADENELNICISFCFRLRVVEHGRDRIDLRAQSVDTILNSNRLLQLAKLRELAQELHAVGRIQRILILDLR